MDPANFVVRCEFILIFICLNCLQNASWIINSLKVYKQALWQGATSSATRINPIMSVDMTSWIFLVAVSLNLLHVVRVSL